MYLDQLLGACQVYLHRLLGASESTQISYHDIPPLFRESMFALKVLMHIIFKNVLVNEQNFRTVKFSLLVCDHYKVCE